MSSTCRRRSGTPSSPHLEGPGGQGREPALRPPSRRAHHPVPELGAGQGAGRPAASTPGDRQVVDQGARVGGQVQAPRPTEVVGQRTGTGPRHDDQAGQFEGFPALVRDDGQHAGRWNSNLGRRAVGYEGIRHHPGHDGPAVPRHQLDRVGAQIGEVEAPGEPPDAAVPGGPRQRGGAGEGAEEHRSGGGRPGRSGVSGHRIGERRTGESHLGERNTGESET